VAERRRLFSFVRNEELKSPVPSLSEHSHNGQQFPVHPKVASMCSTSPVATELRRFPIAAAFHTCPQLV
jgi:hypothetical protein